MIQFPHLRAIAAAAATCGAMFVAGPAHAYVYATSGLNIQNLNLITTQGSAVVTNFTFNLDNSASLNGPPTATSAACGGVPGSNSCSPGPGAVLDAGVANAAGSAPLRTENNFSFLGTAPLTSYSNADSVISTAAVVQGIPTSARQISESLLNTNGSAQSFTNVQSNTSLTFNVTVGFDGATLEFSFLADPDQRTQVNGLPGLYSAQSNLVTSFTLSSASGSVSWSPQGTAGNNCDTDMVGVTCIETADTQDLNRNIATPNVNPITVDNSFDTGDLLTAFGINIIGLQAGDYSLALSSTTSTSITRNVPEPGTTGLIGLALAALAFSARRAKRRTK